MIVRIGNRLLLLETNAGDSLVTFTLFPAAMTVCAGILQCIPFHVLVYNYWFASTSLSLSLHRNEQQLNEYMKVTQGNFVVPAMHDTVRSCAAAAAERTNVSVLLNWIPVRLEQFHCLSLCDRLCVSAQTNTRMNSVFGAET